MLRLTNRCVFQEQPNGDGGIVFCFSEIIVARFREIDKTRYVSLVS